jgi:hypothetical protein
MMLPMLGQAATKTIIFANARAGLNGLGVIGEPADELDY